ncbi:MAG TPA: hypothetical protein VI113_11230, partial [Alphaproteobacteria bacterium]
MAEWDDRTREWVEILRADDLEKARAWLAARRAAGEVELDAQLMGAAAWGATEIAAMLVESGAKINARPKGRMGATALMDAAEGCQRRHLACVERLLS